MTISNTPHTLTILHEVTEELVAHPAVWRAVVLHHRLYLLSGEVCRTTAAQRETTRELGKGEGGREGRGGEGRGREGRGGRGGIAEIRRVLCCRFRFS